MTAVSLVDVSNGILSGVNLKIRAGEFFALMGPSGSGKTTLLNVLAGIAAHQGKIFFDQREVQHLPPHRRTLGYLFQELLLFPHLSVGENLLLAMRALNISRTEKLERVRSLLRLLRIPNLGNRSTEMLSGGERQRVGLARALAAYPRLLLLDEPFSSLDAETAGYLRCEVKALQRRLGITTFLVTHSIQEALELGDRMAIIAEGRIHVTGKPGELLQTHDGMPSPPN